MKGTVYIIWSRRILYTVVTVWRNTRDLFRVPSETMDGPVRVSVAGDRDNFLVTQSLLMEQPATLAGLTNSSSLISARAPENSYTPDPASDN